MPFHCGFMVLGVVMSTHSFTFYCRILNWKLNEGPPSALYGLTAAGHSDGVLGFFCMGRYERY